MTASATPPLVLVADADPRTGPWVAQCLAGAAEVLAVERAAAALQVVDQQSVDLVVVGERIADCTVPLTVTALREQIEARGRLAPRVVLVAGAGAAGEPLDGLYYRLPRDAAPADARPLLHAALLGRPVRGPIDMPVDSPARARRMQRVLDLARRLAMHKDLSGVASACSAAIRDLTECDRAHCLFYDGDSGALWAASGDDDDRVATAGIAGFAARTGAATLVAEAAADGRYARENDDPTGTGGERILAVPIHGSDGQVHAVLVAVRSARRPVFSSAERENLCAFAAQAGPLLAQLSLQLEAEAVLSEQQGDDIFRREAMDAYSQAGRYGDVVRVSPAWITWTFYLVLGLVAIGVAYMSIGEVHQYSMGPAVVRVTDRVDVTANAAGNVMGVEVAPGEEVAAGQPLVRLYDATQKAELARITAEYETQLRNRMLVLTDAPAAAAVRALRVELDRARSALDERVIRAPEAGVVSDVRVREGQPLGQGDVVLSLVDADSALSVIAFLPGGDRPQLRAGMPMRLELHGFQYAYQSLSIETVASQVIGPAEARRYLGPQIADILPIAGSVVVVRARVPAATFQADGKTYQYHDGMAATAEVRVRSERILTALVPGLKRF